MSTTNIPLEKEDRKVHVERPEGNIAIIIIALVAILTLAAIAIDLVVYDYRPWGPDLPIFTPYTLARTGVVAILASLFVFFSLRSQTGSCDTFRPRPLYGRIALSVFTIVTIVIVVMFLSDRGGAFRRPILKGEHGILELAQNTFWFIAFVYFFAVTWMQIRRKSMYSIGQKTLSILITTFFFFLLMEEISWFQHFLDFKTPDVVFDRNWQNETNLHNFHSTIFNFAFYQTTSLLLIFVPFVWRSANLSNRWKRMALYIPGPVVMLCAMFPTAFNIAAWNLIPTQFSLLLSVSIIASILLTKNGVFLDVAYLRPYLPAMVVILILTFLSFSLGTLYLFPDFQGPGQVNDIDEYMELLIPMAFLLYSLEIFLRVRRDILHTTDSCKRQPQSRRRNDSYEL